MSPATATAAQQLRQLIHYHLDNELPQNALFLAGRLHALDPRAPETTHLIALCHLKLGQFRAAYDYARDTRLRSSNTKDSTSSSAVAVLSCAYVFAQACLALRRYSEGISALERCRPLWMGKNHWLRHSETERGRGPDAPAVYNMLGRLCKANGEDKRAAEYFAEALKGNPFMWDAFEGLSDGGIPIRTTSIFNLSDDLGRDLHISTSAMPPPPEPTTQQQQMPPPQVLANKIINDPNTPIIYDPFNTTRSAVDPGLNYGDKSFMSRLNGNTQAPGFSSSDWDTPVTNGIHYDDDVSMSDNGNAAHDHEIPAAPIRKKNGLQTFMTDMIEAPKMRGMTARGRAKPESLSEADARPTSGIPVSHKRTVSGQAPPASSFAGSNDGSSQGTRRSARIQGNATSSSTSLSSKTSASSRLAGVFKTDPREKKELPKVRATGTRGRTGASTVGRVVSGNRKAPGPGERDIDSKESSRPASVASSVRETRETTSRRAVPSQQQQTASIEQQQQQHAEEAMRWLLDLFSKLGEGYLSLSRYNAQKALDTLRSLPISQRETPWVLSKIGRALYERAMYKESADIFAKVRKLGLSNPNVRESGAFGSYAASGIDSPWLDDMHIYSTCLWHLKRDIELAYLAHSLLALDRLAPESWLALGNSFSLARDHDKAIKCFKRAVQLSSGGKAASYAWTLQGHEHIATEEFERAQQCYREAIASDPRHYAGWYGLASVFEKQGKSDIAERHYRIAWDINPRNGVLAICLGMICERIVKDATGGGGHSVFDPRSAGKVREALGWYDRALRLDSSSAKARFLKARTLLRLAQMPNGGGRLESMDDDLASDVFSDGDRNDPRTVRLMQAKKELDVLRETAPEEAMVRFLLGRTLRCLGDRAGAVRELTVALELDPKASPHIKEALESLEGDDDGSWDEDDEVD